MVALPREATECRSCGEPIIWTVTAKSGKRMPVDAEPVESGNLILTPGDPPTAIVLTPEAAARTPFRYISHFATCKQANEWRRS